MNRWRSLCLAEALAILLAWWWLGMTSAPSPADEITTEQVEFRPVDGPEPAQNPGVPTAGADPDSSRAADRAARAPELADLRAWSSGTGLVSLYGKVLGPESEPITNPSIILHTPEGEDVWVPVKSDANQFLLLERPPGTVEFTVSAAGYDPQRTSVELRTEPLIQTATIRLSRSQRVLVKIRTSSGADFRDWLREESIAVGAARFQVQAAPEPVAVDRAIRATIPLRNEYARFVAGESRDRSIPSDCVGALDLYSSAQLCATAWLGSLLLGSARIHPNAGEVVIEVAEREWMQRLGTVRVRVTEAATGQGLEGVWTSLNLPWGGGGPRAMTNSEGAVELRAVIPDIWDFTLWKKGWAGHFRQIDLRPGDRLDLGEVVLGSEERIRARIMDPEGVAVAGMRVFFFPIAGWLRPEDPQRIMTKSNDEGIVEVEIGPTRHQWIVGGGEFGLQAVIWEPGSAEREERQLRLRRGDAVTLVASGSAIGNRLLWLLAADGSLLAPSWQASRPWQGTLTPGNYLLRVEDLDRNFIATLDLLVPEGGGEIMLTLP